MCSASEVKEIVDTALDHYAKENGISHLAKSIFGILALAITSAIGFNTTMLYTMKDTVNNTDSATRYEMLAVVAKNKADMILLLQKNTSMISEIVTWQRLHAVSKDAITSRYDMLIDNNTGAIDQINNSGVDNRWRKRDEEADNRNKALIHEMLKKEDEHLHEELRNTNLSTNIRIENTEDAFEEFADEYYEFHDRIILHLKNSADHVE